MWAQSDKSAIYTSNVTLSTSGGTNASSAKVKLSSTGTEYDAIKAGTGSKSGAVKITVPSGTKYLHLHVAGWNGESVTVSVTPNTNISPTSLSLTADAGISGSATTYILSTPTNATTNYYKVITFTNALTANTDLTFTATSGKRFVIWGVNAEKVHTLTYSATNGNIGGLVYNTSTAVASGASVAEGGKVTLTAQPDDGFEFSSWEVSGTGSSLSSTTDNPTTFTMGTANSTVTANFVSSGGGGTTVLEENDLSLNATEKAFDLKDGANQTFQLTNTGEADGALTFESSDNAVATVSNTGLITAVAVGTAKITVTQAASDTYKGGSAECVVTVTDSRLNVSDMTFTSACGGSGTADDGAVWTVTSDANESVFGSADGLHYGTLSAEVQYVQLSTSDIGGQVSKVVVRTRDTQACATVSVTVGGVSFTCSGSTTATNTSADYTFTGTGSGTIIVRIDRGSSMTSAIWVKGVKVTYLDTRDDADLSFDENEVMIELKDKTYNAINNNSNPLLNPNNLSGFTWTSTNEAVATVNENGLVTLKAVGETTIKASFAGNDSYKPGEASFTLNVVDYREDATVTWKNATGADITELIVEKGQYIENITLSCNVSSFTFTDGNITYVWGNNGTHDNFKGTMPAGYMSSTNSVWTQALGTIDVTATFPGNDTYKPASATLTITVTGGTSTAPYTVAEARAAIDANSGVTNVYAKGIVCTAGTVNDGQISYYISDDGTETNKLQAYKGKGVNGANFTSDDDIQVGDVVVIYGTLKKFSSIYEFDANNQLVSLVRKPAAPTFSPVAGAVAAGTAVTISTKTDGATIYYTTDGTDPTFESSIYSEPIVIDEALTIKAFAVKDALSSNVATAAYTIAEQIPSIVFDGQQNPCNEPYTEGSTNIHYVASNLTGNISLVVCDANGDAATYDWFSAQLNGETYVAIAWEANDDTENSRSAYFYLTDGTTSSEIFAFTQAKYVPDFAELPFEWEGGESSSLTALAGVTANGLGTDYGDTQGDYRVKLDNTGDYIQIKTNKQPGVVTIGVKMIGGATSSTITVQGSADGVSFTDVEELTISGSLNDVLSLKTSEQFAETDRYVRLYFTKGSNVGVGYISISDPSAPVLEVSPYTTNVSSEESDGSLTISTHNFSGITDTAIEFYVKNGNDFELADSEEEPEWITVEVSEDNSTINYYVNANDGNERTAYFKVVFTYGDEQDQIWSGMITITQAKVDFATLPFSWDGQSTTPLGVTNNGVTTYNSSPYLKFDATDDDVVLKLNEAPEWLSFDIKGNSFSGGTFKVQTSEDGETYTDLNTYTELGNLLSETFCLDGNVHFIKWVYTEKVNGNVALGNILATTTESIPISAVGWATYCADVALDFTNVKDLTAYTAELDGDAVKFVKVTGAVPANTGLLVSGTSSVVPIIDDAEAVQNLLVGVTEETNMDAETIFVLKKGDKGLGFYKNSNAFTVRANSAYLPASAVPAGARTFIGLEDGETTSILSTTVDGMSNEIYDLQGRRVSNAQLKKGLYIENGKKIIVK